MGVGVRIVSENLNPEAGLRPKWRQKVMTESLGVGKLSSRSARSARRSSRPSSRRARRRRGGGGGFGKYVAW